MMDPVEQQESQPAAQRVEEKPTNSSAGEGNSPVRKISKKLMLIVGLGATILIAVLLSFFVFRTSSTQQTTKTPPPDPENVLLATVGEKQIFRNDVKKIALKQYLQSAIDSKAMRLFLDVLIERAILHEEARALGIERNNASDEEEYYTSIKARLEEGVISKINATQVTWWIPPTDAYEQIPLYETQRQEGESAVIELERRLRGVERVLDIVDDVYQRYPSLQSIIAVNGTRYKGKQSQAEIEIERDYEYDKLVTYFPSIALMQTLQRGDVKSQTWPNGGGAAVIKINDITRGEKINYREWLERKIEEKVVFNNEGVNAL